MRNPRFINDSKRFKSYFSMPAPLFKRLQDRLGPRLERQHTTIRQPIEPARVSAAALNRFASGESYDRVGDRFGIAHAMAIECTDRVTKAILDNMLGLISFPDAEAMPGTIAKFARGGFANCADGIDCTHFFIEKPGNGLDKDYYDRTRQYSIVAQCVSDMRILDLDAGWPGSLHDSRVSCRSSLYECVGPAGMAVRQDGEEGVEEGGSGDGAGRDSAAPTQTQRRTYSNKCKMKNDLKNRQQLGYTPS
ncbi:hypothetical protein CBR_g40028 [Chara braunii]|uniref:DDE Tnp4 domain-containing protein n=1 Tax=Chara braunii TaxID=69332 RepID=A0A388LST4_CHABU|nr:hypothetical protein CBR_g40028 [Chara braunii]|eukprot:GBG85386.1 hypothetical protein CBR_g40028 [Chara braunii]